MQDMCGVAAALRLTADKSSAVISGFRVARENPSTDRWAAPRGRLLVQNKFRFAFNRESALPLETGLGGDGLSIAAEHEYLLGGPHRCASIVPLCYLAGKSIRSRNSQKPLPG